MLIKWHKIIFGIVKYGFALKKKESLDILLHNKKKL